MPSNFNSGRRIFSPSPRRPWLLATTLTGYLAVFLVPTYAGGGQPARPLSAAKASGYVQRASQCLSRQISFLQSGLTQRPPSPHEQHIALRHQRAQAHLAQVSRAAQTRLARREQVRQARLAKRNQAQQARMAKLTMQHQALTSGNIVVAAYAFRGTRYVFGGTSRSGFDCSGFVRYILSTTGGVDLPRTAVEQYYHGTPIAAQDLQPGDLVFFKNTYKHGISHVGIYAGEGRFIHAANAHKGVRMDALNAPYFASHYAGARRVLSSQIRQAAFAH